MSKAIKYHFKYRKELFQGEYWISLGSPWNQEQRNEQWGMDFLYQWKPRSLFAWTMGSEVKWSEVTQSCPTLCDPMDCSLPGSSVHGIFQARVLE